MGESIKSMPETALSDRLDRLEAKIDKLTEAMISLARTEEKIFALEAEKKTTQDRLNRHAERIDAIAEKVAENSRVINNLVKLTWIIIGTIVAGIAKVAFGI